MPISEARKKANRKWDEANRDRYWQFTIRFPASEKETIVARANQLGLSVSDYIRGRVYVDTEFEKAFGTLGNPEP